MPRWSGPRPTGSPWPRLVGRPGRSKSDPSSRSRRVRRWVKSLIDGQMFETVCLEVGVSLLHFSDGGREVGRVESFLFGFVWACLFCSVRSNRTRRQRNQCGSILPTTTCRPNIFCPSTRKGRFCSIALAAVNRIANRNDAFFLFELHFLPGHKKPRKYLIEFPGQREPRKTA